MITRKTLALFGCNAEAVEVFAREAGLEIEPLPGKTLKKGSWVMVDEVQTSPFDKYLQGWVGQIERLEGTEVAVVDFAGRPWPDGYATITSMKGYVWRKNLKLIG